MQKRQKLPSLILIYNVKSGDCEREVRKDLRLRASQDWLVRLTVWACSNGRSVEILNQRDDSE